MRKHGIGVLAKTPQGLFVVDPKDFGVGRALLERGEYEPDVVAYLLGMTTSESTVVFVGAHIGSIMVPIAKKVSKVIAFEPNPASFELLEANTKLNALDNVLLYRQAVSDSNGIVAINRDAQNTGRTFVSNSDAAAVETVESRRLDDVVADLDIDLMVVDAEGHEVQVFVGSQATLKRTKVLYTEFCPRLLRRHGGSLETLVRALPESFSQMRLAPDQSTVVGRTQWIPVLEGLPQQDRLLLNLTFTA